MEAELTSNPTRRERMSVALSVFLAWCFGLVFVTIGAGFATLHLGPAWPILAILWGGYVVWGLWLVAHTYRNPRRPGVKVRDES
jgi:hypothetical protein